jgi:hypothetical protein
MLSVNDDRTQIRGPNRGTNKREELEMEISALVELIRSLQRTIERSSLEIQEAKQTLRPLLEARGENWTDDVGYARLVSEGVQRAYDADALDRLILSDPLRYSWLKDYRRERVLSERVSIK